MYTLEEEAIRLVIKAFEGQKRIKEDINLSVHSITVGYMLKDLGCKEEVVISALLHDIIEDTEYTYDYIKNHFGQYIADNVKLVSEDTSIKDFYERKKEFISRFEKASDDIILIELADKLHNLVFDYPLWLEKGKEALSTLNITYEMNKWHYTEMAKLFNRRINKNNKLLIRYNDIYKLYFGE